MNVKTKLSLITLLTAIFSFTTLASDVTYEITIKNITKGLIFTPPVFAVSDDKIPIFKVGRSASNELEQLAEGGDTNPLAEALKDEDAEVVQLGTPVLPGESVSVEIDGDKSARLSLATMLLPTNDGFIGLSCERIGSRDVQQFWLQAYDAGTEENDELCTNIPGPLCGGEGIGFTEETGEGFIFPHPNIHGEGELTRAAYAWGEPVAIVTVEKHD